MSSLDNSVNCDGGHYVSGNACEPPLATEESETLLSARGIFGDR
jgi:hypothetical protein